MIRLPIEALLFDLDGTLVDSLALTITCFIHACEVHLGAAPSREWIAATMGRPLLDALEEAAPGRGEELLASYRDHHDAQHDRLLRPYPAAFAAVRRLHAHGFPLGVVTSKRRVAALRALELYNLLPLFGTVVTLEDTVRHKPEPDPLLEGAARLELAPDHVLYVGDSVYDVLAARAASMPVAAALWGAGTETELRALEPDILLAQPDELVEWLIGR